MIQAYENTNDLHENRTTANHSVTMVTRNET